MAVGLPAVVDEAGRERVEVGYDVAGRPVVMRDGLGEQTYAYDAAEGPTTYAYDEADRLQQAAGPDGETVEFAYDAAGNRTRAGDTHFEFAALGRLAAVDPADGERVAYVADGAGVRQRAERADGAVVDYTWDLATANYPLLAIDRDAADGEGGGEAYVRGPAGGLVAAP